MKRLIPFVAVGLIFSASAAAADDGLTPITNLRSGISLVPQGRHGEAWAYERLYHDEKVDDSGVLYVRSTTPIVLEHNERNVVSQSQRYVKFSRIIGRDGPDGKPDSGDEGIIKWMVDSNYRSPRYVGAVAPPTRLYEKPIVFAGLAYSDGKPVVGTTGHNGLPWRAEKRGDLTRWFYGQKDKAGNEWHTLRYWDDDAEWLKRELPNYPGSQMQSGKCGASDGGRVVCVVDPKTPVLQFAAATPDAQWYTTAAKTFDTPVIHVQTTYLTRGVEIRYVNLTNGEPVLYVARGHRVEGPPRDFRTFGDQPLRSDELFGEPGGIYDLFYKCGDAGPVCHRRIVFEPDFPAPGERHGYLLWETDAQKARVRANLEKEPWKTGFARLSQVSEDPEAGLDNPVRPPWRGEMGRAGAALKHAFVGAMTDWAAAPADHGYIAKRRLLRFYAAEPLGIEVYLSTTGGSPDLTPLGQEWLGNYAAPIAYDLLASGYRRSADRPRGMTAIEELKIRDNLAQLAKLWQQFRYHMAAGVGSGSSHWELGYGLVALTTALAMPTYDTPYYGTSGADGTPASHRWAPYPDEAVSWWDNLMRTTAGPGRPNSVASWRYHILYNRLGYWTGPNHLGFIQPDGTRIHYWKYRHNRGQPGQPCYAENGGYENPFIGPGAAVQNLLKISGREPLDLYLRYYERKIEDGHAMAMLVNHRWPFAREAAPLVAKRLADDQRFRTYGFADPLALAFYDPESASRAPEGPRYREPVPVQTVTAGRPVEMSAPAKPEKGIWMAFGYQLPEGASVDVKTGKLTWTPTPEQAGLHRFVLAISENEEDVIMEARRVKVVVPEG